MNEYVFVQLFTTVDTSVRINKNHTTLLIILNTLSVRSDDNDDEDDIP